MKGRACRLALWGLTAACMGGIFALSAQPIDDSAHTSGAVILWLLRLLRPGFDALGAAAQLALIESWQTAVRTLAHFTEYACLGLLLRLLAGAYGRAHPLALGWGGAALYALLDEIHQAFVPGRTCDLLDVGVDALGAALGAALAAGLCAWRRHRKGGATSC